MSALMVSPGRLAARLSDAEAPRIMPRDFIGVPTSFMSEDQLKAGWRPVGWRRLGPFVFGCDMIRYTLGESTVSGELVHVIDDNQLIPVYMGAWEQEAAGIRAAFEQRAERALAVATERSRLEQMDETSRNAILRQHEYASRAAMYERALACVRAAEGAM